MLLRNPCFTTFNAWGFIAPSTIISITCLTLSCLDYCNNNLVMRTHSYQILKLQSVINMALHLISLRVPFGQTWDFTWDHLHWLSVTARIKFKVCVLTWKCLNSVTPDYLRNTLSLNNNECRNTLYSTSKSILEIIQM